MYRARAWSARDSKRLRKMFATLAAAHAWRSEAQIAIRRGRLRAAADTTLQDAARELVDGFAGRRVISRRGGMTCLRGDARAAAACT